MNKMQELVFWIVSLSFAASLTLSSQESFADYSKSSYSMVILGTNCSGLLPSEEYSCLSNHFVLSSSLEGLLILSADQPQFLPGILQTSTPDTYYTDNIILLHSPNNSIIINQENTEYSPPSEEESGDSSDFLDSIFMNLLNQKRPLKSNKILLLKNDAFLNTSYKIYIYVYTNIDDINSLNSLEDLPLLVPKIKLVVYLKY